MAKRNTNKIENTIDNAQNTIEIAVSKTGGKSPVITKIDAVTVLPVTPENLVQAGNTVQSLCINMLSDNVHPDIVAAVSVKGGLTKLFGGKVSEADLDAMRKLAKSGHMSNDNKKTVEIRGKWAAFVDTAKRVRCISLQRLVKLFKEEATEDKITLKQALTAWCTAHPKETEENLPQGLYDILVDFEVLGQESE